MLFDGISALSALLPSLNLAALLQAFSLKLSVNQLVVLGLIVMLFLHWCSTQLRLIIQIVATTIRPSIL
jgi:hypothetical protein